MIRFHVQSLHIIVFSGILFEIHSEGQQLQSDSDEQGIWDDRTAVDGRDHTSAYTSTDTTPLRGARVRCDKLWVSICSQYSTSLFQLLYLSISICQIKKTFKDCIQPIRPWIALLKFTIWHLHSNSFILEKVKDSWNEKYKNKLYMCSQETIHRRQAFRKETENFFV